MELLYSFIFIFVYWALSCELDLLNDGRSLLFLLEAGLFVHVMQHEGFTCFQFMTQFDRIPSSRFLMLGKFVGEVCRR